VCCLSSLGIDSVLHSCNPKQEYTCIIYALWRKMENIKSDNTTLHQEECTVSTNVDTSVLTGSSNHTNKNMKYYKTGACIWKVKQKLWGVADKSLAQPTSQCRRTESIVSLERWVCSCAKLQVFSCCRGFVRKHIRRHALFEQHRDASCHQVSFSWKARCWRKFTPFW
jgi:hypothetical protein